MSQKKLTWAGWILTGLLSALFLFSATMKFAKPPEMLEQWTGKTGFPESALLPIAITEVVCVALFLVPRTAMLGAVLLTGYLGGTISAHVRIGEPIVANVIFGVLVWFVLFLREPRLRKLLPILRPNVHH